MKRPFPRNQPKFWSLAADHALVVSHKAIEQPRSTVPEDKEQISKTGP
jgi:hypothetical protein